MPSAGQQLPLVERNLFCYSVERSVRRNWKNEEDLPPREALYDVTFLRSHGACSAQVFHLAMKLSMRPDFHIYCYWLNLSLCPTRPHLPPDCPGLTWPLRQACEFWDLCYVWNKMEYHGWLHHPLCVVVVGWTYWSEVELLAWCNAQRLFSPAIDLDRGCACSDETRWSTWSFHNSGLSSARTALMSTICQLWLQELTRWISLLRRVLPWTPHVQRGVKAATRMIRPCYVWGADGWMPFQTSCRLRDTNANGWLTKSKLIQVSGRLKEPGAN